MNGGKQMESNKRIRPLTEAERKFAEENYCLISRFLRYSRLDQEEFYDIAALGYLLSVEIYLNNAELRKKCCFKAVSYMYMRRAVYRYCRQQKAMKRCSADGKDTSFEVMENYIEKSAYYAESYSSLECREAVKQIESSLTAEQRKIFRDRIKGYSLKEIAENIKVDPKRVYQQFGKIKNVAAKVMEI